MQSSSCQNKTGSCGTCCGIFNFKTSISQIKNLLEDRSNKLKDIINDKNKLINYRNEQEEIENNIPRHDNEVYICPFLGFINEKEKRIGCMIHPIITNDH